MMRVPPVEPAGREKRALELKATERRTPRRKSLLVVALMGGGGPGGRARARPPWATGMAPCWLVLPRLRPRSHLLPRARAPSPVKNVGNVAVAAVGTAQLAPAPRRAREEQR